MANFTDLSLGLIKVILTHNNINRRNAKSLGVVCRTFHRAFEDLFPPTINLSGRFTVQVLHNLFVDFESNPMFPIKVRRMIFSNSTSYDEQYFFQLMDDLFSRIQNIREVCINLTHKRNDDMSSSLINYFSNLSYQQRILLQSLEVNNIINVGDLQFNGPEVQLDIKQVLQNCGPSLRNFSISYRKDNQYQCPFFFSSNNNNNTTVVISSVERIELVDSCSSVDKSFLEFLILNQLRSLKTLNLFLTSDDRNLTLNDPIWNQVKDYCNNNLKKFNICIRHRNADLLFSHNNCLNIQDDYNNKQHYVMRIFDRRRRR